MRRRLLKQSKYLLLSSNQEENRELDGWMDGLIKEYYDGVCISDAAAACISLPHRLWSVEVIENRDGVE